MFPWSVTNHRAWNMYTPMLHDILAKSKSIVWKLFYQLKMTTDNGLLAMILLCLQISYASTSATLSDRTVYPSLFRTVPSDEPLAPALATLLQYYGWRQLSILTEEKPQFITVFVPLTLQTLPYSFIWPCTVQLLPSLDAALSKAKISIEDSIQFTEGNLSEAAKIIFVS